MIINNLLTRDFVTFLKTISGLPNEMLQFESSFLQGSNIFACCIFNFSKCNFYVDLGM